MKKYFSFIIALSLFISGCSLQKIALRSTTGLLYHSIDALYSEPDLQIAEQAIASNLKLLEGLHQADPKNEEILLLLTQGYASYSLGFVEDVDEERAKLFYLRARDYGIKLLQRTKTFKDSIPIKEITFVEKINHLSEKDIPTLFWTGFAWGGWINLSKDDPQAIFDLGKVKAMMSKVLELDEAFFFGASHLFFGSIYGSMPKILGGDPDMAREHFEKCLKLSNEKFILAYVYLARYYAQPLLDEVLFDEYLDKVVQAPVEILPGNELITAIAKDKAKKLVAFKEELF